jgi:hypothetical protein
MRLAFALAAVLILAPAAAFAGKGGGGGGSSGTFPAGDYFFVDKVSFDKIKSLAVIDQVFDEFCINAIAVYLDTTSTLNRRVEFEFHSLGTIERESSSKVDGLFTTVDLRLTVFDGPETTNATLFDSTVSGAPCELDGRMTKAGEQLKATLQCELGPNLAAKGVVPQTVLDSIAFALGKKKSIRIDVSSGDFRINHNGIEVDPVQAGLDFSMLDCPTSSDGGED